MFLIHCITSIAFTAAAAWILILAIRRRRMPLALLGVMLATLAAAEWIVTMIHAAPAPYPISTSAIVHAGLHLVGAIVAVVVAALLTSRRSQTHTVLTNEDHLRLIGQLTTNGVVIVDADSRIQWINERYTEMTGWTLDDLKGKKSFEVNTVGLEDQAGLKQVREQTSAGRGFSTEISLRRKDGGLITLSIVAEPLTDADGRVTGFVGINTDVTEQRAAESKAAETQRLLTFFSDNVEDGIWVWNLDSGQPEFISPSFAKLFGMTTDEFYHDPSNWLKCVHPDDRDECAAHGKTALEQGWFDHEYKIVGDDGQDQIYRCHGVLVPAEPGAPKRMIGMTENVTRQRLAEKSIRDNEAMFQAITRHADEVIWSYDEINSRPEFVSPAQEALTGRSVADYIAGKWHIRDIIHPDDIETYNRATDRLKEHKPYRVEYRLQHTDGSYRHVIESGNPVVGADGVLERSVGVASDLTERKTLEQQLSESQRLFESAVIGGDLGVWTLDLDTNTLTINDRWAEMLGESTEDIGLTGEDWSSRVHPEDLPAAMEDVQRVLSGEQDTHDHTQRLRHKDGSYRWINCRARVTQRDADGRALQISGTHLDVTEKLDTERSLAEANRKLETAIDTAGLGTWTRDLTTGEVTINENYARNLGFEPGEFEPGSEWWRARVHPDDLETVVENGRKTRAGEQDGHELLVRARHKDGRYRTMLCRTVALAKDEHGKPTRFAGAQLDVTNQESLKRQLNESRSQLENAISAAELGTWELDFRTNKLAVNDRWAQMLGLDPADLTGTLDDCMDLMHPGDKEAVNQALAEHIRGERESLDMTVRFRHADGQWRYIHDRARVIEFDAEGAPLRAAGAHLDITDRVLADRRLAESELRFQRIVDTANEGIWISNAQGQITYANDRLCQILGRPVEEIMGKTTDQFLAEGEDWDTSRGFAAYVHQRKGINERRLLRPDGAEVHTLASVSPNYDPDGQFIGATAMLTDITDYRRLMARFNQSQKLEAVGQLAAGVTHDFKNLLSAITGHIGLAQETLDADHPAYDSLENVRAATEQARAVTSSLLELTASRESTDKNAVTDVPSVVSSTLALLEHSTNARIEIVCEAPSDPVFARASDTDLQRIMLNMGLNARDAMPTGGTLRVSTSATESNVTITIADTGPGIDPAIRDRVFEPFFSTKKKSEGTGLGLAIVHSTIQRLGGSIEIEPTREGATFVVTLPRAAAPALQEAPSDNSHPRMHARSVSLYIADEHVRRLIGSGFRSAGWRIADGQPNGSILVIDDESHPSAPQDSPRALYITDRPDGISTGRTISKPFTIKDLIAQAEALALEQAPMQNNPQQEHAAP